MTISGNQVSSSYLPAGNFVVRVHSSTYGFAILTNPQVSVAFPGDPTATSITSSFVGGKELAISGAGFVTNNFKNN